jgi:hypothetical protein
MTEQMKLIFSLLILSGFGNTHPKTDLHFAMKLKNGADPMLRPLMTIAAQVHFVCSQKVKRC